MARPDEELPLSPLKPVPEDVARELADHLDRRTEELVADGWTREAAQAEARRVFGDVTSISAECRDITRDDRRARRRGAWFDALRHDLAFGVRLLRRSPGFTVVAVLTLALGIGANAAVFSVINALVLRPLPYTQPDRLVDLAERTGRGTSDLAWANFVDLQSGNHSFEAMAAYGGDRATILGGDVPQRLNVAQVSRDFFGVMQPRVILGRLPAPEDFHLGATPVAVVSARYWRDHLHATKDLSQQTLRGEFTFQIVGVVADGFAFPDATDLWYPLELDEQAVSRTAHNWSAIGRLKPGVSAVTGARDLDLIVARIAASQPESFDAKGIAVTPLQEQLTAPIRRPLYLLLGAAALVLLTACTNLASTLLARGAVRAQELAIRTAIGAGRGRLLRQIFTESLLLAVLGCAAGLALGAALVKVLLAVAPPSLLMLNDAHLDLRVLLVALVTSIGTAVLFGLLPGLRVSRVHPGQLMRSGIRGGGGGPRRAVWSTLVVAEVALAVVLLVGSSLLLRSFAAVLRVDLGFDPQQTLTVTVNLPEQAYPTVADAAAFHDRTLAAIRALPGVQYAGIVNRMPLEGAQPNGGLQVEGKAILSTARPITGTGVYRIVSAGYFDAMGVRVLRGRDFTEQDNSTAPRVVIINQAFALRDWPGADPIGKRMRIGGMDGPGIDDWATVVGVVHDVPDVGVTAPAHATYFFPYRQLPRRSRNMIIAIRSTTSASALTASVRRTVSAFAPAVPLEFLTMEQRVSATIADQRFTMLLVSGFGVVALLLAAVGIYGVVSYSVAQRTREIGIRMALGAAPARVGWMVHREVLGIVAIGIVAGGAAALALSGVMRSLLFGIVATDPASFAGVAFVLLITSIAATTLPAWRGTRVDPMTAIRNE